MFQQVVDAARQLLVLLRDVETNKQGLATLTEQLRRRISWRAGLPLRFSASARARSTSARSLPCNWRTPSSVSSAACRRADHSRSGIESDLGKRNPARAARPRLQA